MAKLQRNFIKGRMNKSLDERLVPNGEYIDALNVRVGSTELSEVGVIENSKGNTKLTTLDLVAKDRITFQLTSYPLSSDAKCIGAYEDSANETIYWFVTDPSHTGPQVTNKLDLIVSYDVNDSTVTYHVVSVDDGGGVNTSLNFNSDYLITGVDKVDDLLFFTDNFNQPRMINVTREYPTPGYVGGLPTEPYLDAFGAPTFFAESLLVIKKPPVNSPTFELVNSGVVEDFLKDRFICFAYRYRYEDDMYSATSQFTNVAFTPKSFFYDSSSFLNEGMENLFDTAIITFNSGSKLVVGIDLLFKEASNPVIRLIEKLDKEDLGYSDNQDYTYKFSNNKIYTILDDNEILRLYDNVPLKAKAQTVMGSRLVYGNYVDGFDVDDTKMLYVIDHIPNKLGETEIPGVFDNGSYSIGPPITQNNSIFSFDLDGIDLKSGTRLDFVITFQHGSYNGAVPPGPLSTTSDITASFSYLLQSDFSNAYDLSVDVDFKNKIGTDANIKLVYNPGGESSCDGFTFTDLINCLIPTYQIASPDIFTKIASGETAEGQAMKIKSSVLSTSIGLQLPAMVYDPTPLAPSAKFYEYYEVTDGLVIVTKNSDNSSLHSDRDYEVGMMYMDEFNRSTTVLVSPNNIVRVQCSNSVDKNQIRVTISENQIPPIWAKRYKFAIKQDRELYETIYSDSYFFDEEGDFNYFLLDGENAQKVEEGDSLKVKVDGAGPKTECINVTVLEKKAQEKGFLKITEEFSGQEFDVPSGVYMKIRNSNIVINNDSILYRDLGLERSNFNYGWSPNPPYNGSNPYPLSGGNAFPVLKYNKFSYANQFLTIPVDPEIPRGTVIRIRLFMYWQNWGAYKKYTFEKEYTSSQNHADIIDWWNVDNIFPTISSGNYEEECGNFIITACPPFALPLNRFQYISSVGNTLAENIYGGSHFGTNTSIWDWDNTQYSLIRWLRDPTDGAISLAIKGNNALGVGPEPYIECRFQIIKPGAVIAFETQPQDAAPDIWYESPVSYPITGGFHIGNVQDQTAVQPAIINTAFENCFTFGNGIESYKIKDSITRSTFGLGNRVSSVLKGDDFKEVHRFADLTYSGIYSYNINNFNEFNLGLLNFKALEPSFGVIQKIFARQTDILVLQEDKISYVLAGKNLLSDSAAGGVVTSAPDVLGTQIARMEEYGIGNNAESFAVYGFEKYFTDSKRGVVIQLKGSAYSNEQLTVISNLGMSSWFRDLFLDYPNTQKLGGYDPYAKEYVLVSNQTLLPTEEEIIEGGTKTTVIAGADKPVTQKINLGAFAGDVTLTYSVKDIRNEFLLRVEYDSVNYDTSLTAVSLGSVTIPKNSVNPQTAILTVTSVTALSNSKIELDVQLSKPEAPTLKIIQVCVSDDNEGLETIHNEYQWISGTFVSPLHSQFVSLSEGTDSPLVSQYNEITGQQGGGVIPVNGATVEIISKRYQSDNFAFDNTVNNFGYLRSSTLYSNTPTDIASLIAASTPVIPVGSGSVFSGSFTMPTSTDQYLYLIYNYRKPVAITLCYSNTSADDACCTCGTSGTYYIDAPILQEATAVYTTGALTTKATDGWYSYQGYFRYQDTGVLLNYLLCESCILLCGTTLLMSIGTGYYTINADLGAATGAVVIDIDFKTLPDGIKVVYNGVTYNSVYSPNFGYLSSTGTEPLYGGITAFDCGISGNTYESLDKYQFNGNGFDATGQSQSVTVDPASVQLQASGLGTCKIIIPKTAASPSIAEITVISPCNGAEIDIDVFCPAALPTFLLTRTGPEPTNISGLCSTSVDEPFYHVVVNGTPGNPAVGDIMYQDANGSSIALPGFYAVVGYPSSAGVIEVDANGIIINSIVACIP